MILLEPNLPAMPVNVTGPNVLSGTDPALLKVREASCYGSARALVRLARNLCSFTLLTVLGYCLLTHRGPAAWLMVLITACGLTTTIAVAEVAVAVFDCADLQLRPRDEVSSGASNVLG